MTPRREAVLAACALAVTLAMGLSIRNGFVYDDLPAIVQNPHVVDPAEWHTIPTSPYLGGNAWRPVTIVGFALQWWLGGGAPWIFHFVLLIGYLGTGMALFALLKRLGIDELAAAAATLLFLVHPVHTEVVANGVGQAEIWTALALLTATSIYLRARHTGVILATVAALLAMVTIGIASKEQGFMVPLLLAAAEWLLLAGRKDALAARLRLLIPVTALTLLLFVLRATIVGSFKGASTAMALHGLRIGGRIVTFVGVIPEYVRLLVWPVHLQADYGPPGIPIGGSITPRHLLGTALLLAFVTLFLYCRRRAPVVAFGLCWAAVTLAPVANLLTATGIVIAERVLFLPSIGFAIVLGAALQALAPAKTPLPGAALAPGEARGEAKWRNAALATVLVTWGVMLTVRSATRVPTWSTQRRFYTDLPQDAPMAYRAWKVAGEYWEGAGDHPRAIADLRRALELYPLDYQVHERLGQFLRTDGQCAAAIPVLAAGLQLGPDIPSLRAKLIECLLTEHQWDQADRYAAEARVREETELLSQRIRTARLRAAADSMPRRH